MTSTDALNLGQHSQSLGHGEGVRCFDLRKNKKNRSSPCRVCALTADKEPLWAVRVIYCKQCGFFLPFRHPTLLKLAVGWPPAKICFFTSRFQVGIALTGCIHLCRTGAWRCVGLLLMSIWGFGELSFSLCGCAPAPHPSETSTDEIKSQAFYSIKPQPSCDPAALYTNTMTRDATGPDRRARGTSVKR